MNEFDDITAKSVDATQQEKPPEVAAKELPPKTPLQKFHRAWKRKIEIPIPNEIVPNPSRELLKAYVDLRTPYDRFWGLLAEEAERFGP